jgi:uncharacterized protein YbjT (DUF2867 family)
MTLKNILVTGATGKQGGALITALLSSEPQQFNIYALTRNSKSTSSQRLKSKGVIVIQGDTAKPDAIFSQIPQPYGVFLVTLPTSNEKDQAIRFIDTSIVAGVQQFIFTSVDRGGPIKSETDSTPVPHFGIKMAIEKHLKESTTGGSRMKWTILRPTSFMENVSPGFIGKAAATALKQMGDVKLSLISTRDIGKAAAKAFAQPDVYAGRALTLTGDLLTFKMMNEVFKEETGKDIPVTYKAIVNGLEWAISDLGVSMKYFRDGGYDYEMDGDLAKELGLRDYRTWLKEDGFWI